MLPRVRQEGIVVQKACDEVVVYDVETNKAHCLGPAAAAVWRQCDGKTPVSEISATLRQKKLGADDEMVWMIVHRLGRLNLLEKPVPLPNGAISSSRRALMRKLLAVGGITALLTSTIVAPTAARAASGGDRRSPETDRDKRKKR